MRLPSPLTRGSELVEPCTKAPAAQGDPDRSQETADKVDCERYVFLARVDLDCGANHASHPPRAPCISFLACPE
jgi:hypothetical protein